ncbi:HEAT repeat domain-containing protein [Planktothrix mougeotii]|uniref:HEAT repeat domain-containing protein n=1 Tax=Planktothrix mougeotii LEGE 06226 TaxID=1828728 RepID=A0ABR9UIA7_9CYAN|nr:HEAT repeat domain-containing protein [Planktothrix mougeotii]MBE9145319.1 HEAT repeat domain-containing protein [Planktothrix mougeotii LEGE 06226]
MDNLGYESMGENTPQEGESLTIEQAIANLQHEELGRRYYAAWWLGRFRVNQPAAVDALILALKDESDRTEEGGYPLRRNAARALGKLGDKRAVSALIDCLDCSDVYVREAATQALEQLGDEGCISALMKLLEGGVAAAQRVPGKPYLVQPYDAILEALGALKATVAIPLVQPFIEHSIPKVQYAALRALYQLTGDNSYGERLIEALKGNDLTLRRTALMDLGAIGYLPAAKAIANTLAENSLKLISLKGVLEHQLTDSADFSLSESAIEVMELMDSLL